MKTVLKMIALLALTSAGMDSYAQAQNEEEAVRYGFTPLNGSARYVAMGGAFNALGGDMSSIGYNPAATAVFLSNEFVFSLGLASNATSNNYLGRTSDNLESKFNIPSFGIISANPVRNSAGKWKTVNFGFAYNRIKDFNSSTIYRGDSKVSLVDQVLVDQQLVPIEDLYRGPFAGEVGIGTQLLGYDTATGQYYTNLDTGMVSHNYDVLTKGKIGENLITFGANYDNKLYLGAAIGILGVNYTSVQTFREETEASTPNYIHSFTYQETRQTTGTGYNLKLGGIYRVAEMLRFGLSYQTPTTFILTHQAYAYGDVEGGYNQYDTESIIDQYNFVVPGRIGFGAAYLFGKKGLISVDYNRQDFSQSKVKNQKYADNSNNINNLLSTYLTATNQVKIGGEYRIERLALRAGFGYQDNPYKKAYTLNATAATTYSAGLGYNFDNVSLDFGFANTVYKEDNLLYPKTEFATTKRNFYSANMTLVFRY